MKICWDNLERIEYIKNGIWRNIKTKKFWIVIDECQVCKNPFLTQINGKNLKPSIGKVCSKSCQGKLQSERLRRKGNPNWKGGVYKNNKPLYNYYKERLNKFNLKCREGKENLTELECGICNEWFIPDTFYLLNIFNGIKRNGKYPIYCSNKCKLEYKRKSNNPNWKGGYCGNNIPTYDTYAPQLFYCEEVRRSKNDRNILEVRCSYNECRKWYTPTSSQISGRIQSLKGSYTEGSEQRFYCSDECKKKCSIYGKMAKTLMKEDAIMAGRDPWWEMVREVQPELRQMVFKRDKYQCIKCGSKEDLHCHHIEGTLWNPLESADMDICITVCKECHKKIHQIPGCGYHDMRCNE